jgi:uncharacterized DUF497 family protein
MKFAWDPRKEATNLAKHGVPFSEAEQAFSDPLAVVAFDEVHSPRGNLNFVGGSSERLERESCLYDTLTVRTGSSGLLVPVTGK